MSRFKALIALLPDVWLIVTMMIVAGFSLAALVNGEGGDWPWVTLVMAGTVIGWLLTLHGKAIRQARRLARRERGQ